MKRYLRLLAVFAGILLLGLGVARLASSQSPYFAAGFLTPLFVFAVLEVIERRRRPRG